MAKGLSLHLGLNKVSPAHYDGWDGQLTACEADAKDMEALARSMGYSTTVMLTKAATRAKVLAALAKAAKSLSAGDIFFFTYSGHGGQLPDKNGDEPDDMRDETWCLFDGELVDDELYSAYARFRAGVRILVLSDSCHSGTVIKNSLLSEAPRRADKRVFRAMPSEKVQSVYFRHQAFYDKILASKSASAKNVAASVLLISGCQDNQLSADGAFNGLFTGTLKSVWNGGTFKGDYRQFHRAIVKRMPPDQTPNLFMAGAPSDAFRKERPFSVDSAAKKAARKSARSKPRKALGVD